jgi:hypothetical protein
MCEAFISLGDGIASVLPIQSHFSHHSLASGTATIAPDLVCYNQDRAKSAWFITLQVVAHDCALVRQGCTKCGALDMEAQACSKSVTFVFSPVLPATAALAYDSPATCPPLPRRVVPPAGRMVPTARGRGAGGCVLVCVLRCSSAVASSVVLPI